MNLNFIRIYALTKLCCRGGALIPPNTSIYNAKKGVNMKIFSEKGNSMIAIPIVVMIIFFIFTVFSITFVNILKPFVVYEKLSSTSLKYIFIMEEYGYLTNKERDKLKKDLENKGLEKEKINLRATGEKQDYGEPLSLILSYECPLTIPTFNNSFIPILDTKNIEVKVTKYSFSKR